MTRVLLALQCRCKEEWVQSNESLGRFYILLPVSSGVEGYLLKPDYQAVPMFTFFPKYQLISSQEWAHPQITDIISSEVEYRHLLFLSNEKCDKARKS